MIFAPDGQPLDVRGLDRGRQADDEPFLKRGRLRVRPGSPH
jgi:hypothetical protein